MMEYDKKYVVDTRKPNQISTSFFKKSHELVFSRMKLSPREHDLMALFLSALHKDHWDDFIDKKCFQTPVYKFQSEVLCNWLGIPSSKLYSTIVNPAKRLSERSAGFRNSETQEFDFKPLFTTLKYRKGALSMTPNPELMKVYLCLSGGHAQVRHKVFRSLKSEHSKRLYSILSRFKDGSFELHEQTLDELYGIFGLLGSDGKLKSKSYARTNNFIKTFIKDSITEIINYDSEIEFFKSPTSQHFGFQPIRKSGKIVAIKFLFEWRKPHVPDSFKSKKDLNFYHQLFIRLMDDQDLSVFGYSPEDLNELIHKKSELESLGAEYTPSFYTNYAQALYIASSQY